VVYSVPELDTGIYSMARRIRNADLETRQARTRLKARGKPYWQAIGLGLHLGYRKSKGRAVWVVRRYLGSRTYRVETVALADDTEDADGANVLTFWQAQAHARDMRAPRGGPYTVNQAVSDYLSGHLVDKASHDEVRARLRAYVPPHFAGTPVDELTADQLRKWHRDIANVGPRIRTRRGAKQRIGSLSGDEAVRKRRASANRCLAWLKAALNYAVSSGKVTCAPVWSQVKAFKGVDIPRSRYLTVDECRRLMEAANPEFRILVEAALQTGARYSELARLRVGDFNPVAGTLHIRQSKSGKNRHILLTDEGRAFFEGLVVGRQQASFLLGREWKQSQQALPMSTACTRAGIEGATFHALRHTWASLSVMSGMPLLVVARNLGHSDTRMVEKCYGHLAPSFIADAIRNHAPRFGL
jgi:integrase